jgi:hypothetical protein
MAYYSWLRVHDPNPAEVQQPRLSYRKHFGPKILES